jgi:peptidoglycan hydrolase-like amidase
MSQNGANRMAAAGFSCNEILQQFFPGTILVSYGD